MYVVKRDGKVKSFNYEKIFEAIEKAYKEVYGDDLDCYYPQIEDINDEIFAVVEGIEDDYVGVEEIQDIVVRELNKVNKRVSKAYNDYRNERTFEREKKSEAVTEIDNIINQVSEETTSNGNVDGSKIQTIRALVANVFTRKYAEYKYIPKDIRDKQKKELYYHDAQYVGLPFFNCCNAEWEEMFRSGFILGTTRIETPKSLATAVNILTQVASHISSNTFGGTTFGNLGSGLTPYAKLSLEKYRATAKVFVEFEKQEDFAWYMLEKEIKDSMQSLEYEVQTLMTSRGETPFLTLGLDIPKAEYNNEERKIHNMIITAILNQRLKGLTGGVTPVFPKLVFQLKDGVNLNPKDKDYELFKLATKVSANRQYPDYIMSDRLEEVTGGIKFPMG